MKNKEIFLADEEQTEEAGRALSKYLFPSDIVKITGSLGAGKTTLVRGIVSGFGGNPELVHSPTFSIVHEYTCSKVDIIHCDFYRLPVGSELDDLGGAEFFGEEKLYLLEWASNIRLEELTIHKPATNLDLRHDAKGRILTFPEHWTL